MTSLIKQQSRVADIHREIRSLKKIDVMPNNSSREKLQGLIDELQSQINQTQNDLQKETEEYRQTFSCWVRSLGCGAASNFFIEHIQPRKKFLKLIESILLEGSQKLSRVEFKEVWGQGIYGVYNPLLGEIEWRTKKGGAIAGVWNPIKQVIEWKEKSNGGVAGVWNPLKKIVEWKEKWDYVVAGVWNPDLEVVEWKEKWHHGVAGMWNPSSRRVEWYDEEHHGVAIALDVDSGGTETRKKRDGGCGAVYWDGSKLLSSGSFYSGSKLLSSSTEPLDKSLSITGMF